MGGGGVVVSSSQGSTAVVPMAFGGMCITLVVENTPWG